MDIELRNLKASDMGIVCKILSGIGFNKIKECFNVEDFISTGNKEEDNKAIEKLGFNIIMDVGGIILENVPMVQDDVNKFLASLSNRTIKEIQDLPIADYGELIITVIQKEDFKDFFKRVVKLFKASDM